MRTSGQRNELLSKEWKEEKQKKYDLRNNGKERKKVSLDADGKNRRRISDKRNEQKINKKEGKEE